MKAYDESGEDDGHDAHDEKGAADDADTGTGARIPLPRASVEDGGRVLPDPAPVALEHPGADVAARCVGAGRLLGAGGGGRRGAPR
ncbi:hypothetical protein RKD38_004568 [Streptomyces ambofaciens]